MKNQDLVSNHSGKIAITYAFIAGVIALRSYVIDKKDRVGYELCALPPTSLAMLQILLSCPWYGSIKWRH
ncbi:valyl-tRNA synthetase [Rickettsia canadensis str. McKiel]|uniref:Valyl-tRNA synthetase n=1 Tax=Rickettsia canadensis (strain McKiel) TaxID=293613 RepID=A8EZR1_RICCK|nr:hypothetical protein [Rickettsia canadensis]ABV73844.1 valyl-tRNA synthetase [Rickettsia canadensis str. McKiel]